MHYHVIVGLYYSVMIVMLGHSSHANRTASYVTWPARQTKDISTRPLSTLLHFLHAQHAAYNRALSVRQHAEKTLAAQEHLQYILKMLKQKKLAQHAQKHVTKSAGYA